MRTFPVIAAVAFAALAAGTNAFAEESFALVVSATSVPEVKRVESGTVAANLGEGKALFSSNRGSLLVRSGKKLDVRNLPSHPSQSGHVGADTISLGAMGALALLRDAKRRLKIVRFDAATQTWVAVARPIGFVPEQWAVLPGGQVVFPQGATSPAWFVYVPEKSEILPVPRPEDVSGCAGSVAVHNGDVLVFGADEAGQPCGLQVDPASQRWTRLPAPPRDTCSAQVERSADTLFFFGGACDAKDRSSRTKLMSYDLRNKKYAEHPDAPDDLSENVSGWVATDKHAGVWTVSPGVMRTLVFDRRAKKWSRAVTAVPTSSGLVAPIADNHWWVTTTLAGKPVLLDVRWAPRASKAQRDKAQASIDAVTGAAALNREDWSEASEEEQRDAIEKGHGAVERYMPRVVDPKTKKQVRPAMWVFALGDQAVPWEVAPGQCERFIDRMVRKWPTTSVGEEFETERGKGFARHGKKLLYGPASACAVDASCESDYVSQNIAPLSQIGPIFSYTTSTSAARGCAAAVGEERWTALDLRSGAPASMTAVIDEKSLFEALKKLPTLRTVLSDEDSLDAVLSTLRAHDPIGFVGYAFAAYNPVSGLVDMRLEYHPEGPDVVEALRVKVKPKPEFRELFERAARVSGLLMSQ